MSSILGREGADPRNLGHLYLAVVKSVLLFGAETWVATLCIGSLLERFQHRVDISLVVIQPLQCMDGIWIYPPLEYSLRASVLEEMETYISRRHNTVSQYIVT